MIGAAMKKIDWKNLSYDDFTGFVAVTAFLLFVLYFGGLWYTTYDYRIQMRDQMVGMYQQPVSYTHLTLPTIYSV